MEDNYWGDLVYSLQKGRCILVLGSGLSTGKSEDGAERPLTEMLAQRLANQMEQANKVFDGNTTNLFQVANAYVRYFGVTALERETEEFYKNDRFTAPNEIQNTLAALPFHLVLNAAPDDLFYKALGSAGKDVAFLQYKRPGTDGRTVLATKEKPQASHPLLYNLLGIWSDPKSVVLTEKAQLDYLTDVIQNNDAIPNSLLEVCKVEKNVFIFLGFDFESWQLRLLLRALKISSDDIRHLAVQKPASLRPDTRVFFKDQYGVRFVDLDARDFVVEFDRRFREKTVATDEATPLHLHAVILYAKEDNIFREELETHMAPLHEHRHIETWSDAMIAPGEVVEAAMQKAIDNAEIIIVLASADLVASEKLYREHLTRAIQRLQDGKVKIMAIIVRNFSWEETLIAQLPIVLPRYNGDVKPIAEWEQRDDAYAEIVDRILLHVKFLTEK